MTDTPVVEYTQEAKVHILKQVLSEKIPLTEVDDELIESVSISIRQSFGNCENFIDLGVIGILAIQVYKWTLNEILDDIRDKCLVDNVFFIAQSLGDADKILDEAEKVVVHIDKDGNTYEPTFH